MAVERKAKDMKEVSKEINLICSIVSLSSVSEKTLDFSTLKNKEVLRNGEKLLFKCFPK